MAEVTAVVSQQATRGRRGDEQGPQGVVVTNGVRTVLALVRWRLPLALIQAVRCCKARRGRWAQHAAQRKGTRFARPVPRSHEARPARFGTGRLGPAQKQMFWNFSCSSAQMFWGVFRSQTPSNFPSHQNHIETLNITNDLCMEY